MADDNSCCETTACCGGPSSAEEYEYGPQAFISGEVDTIAGPIPKVAGTLTQADRVGALRVLMGIGRDSYRIRPGLYAVGQPDDLAPVVVTANYKLTFDRVRSTLAEHNAWILVLDTKGINVWCAAGKGTFGTRELGERVLSTQLAQVVSHNTLVVPQFGATGVSASQVRSATGFRVVWGPVDVADLPAFLDDGNKAAEGMRRVGFAFRDRAILIPVELSVAWRRKVLLAAFAYLAVLLAAFALGWAEPALVIALSGVALLVGLLGGAVVVPLLLPWIPGRAFAMKGALVGAVIGAALAFAWPSIDLTLGVAVVAMTLATASFAAMNFTGATTFTSPSGVEWEMRRYIPVQAAGLGVWLIAGIAYLVVAT